MKLERIVFNEEKKVTLDCFTIENSLEFKKAFYKKPAVLVIPGGAYQMCSDREAEPVAMYYVAKGYQAFVLRYTLKDKGLWPDPLNDYEEAMKYIIDNADKYNVDPKKIATIGFSAGAHLAASGATISKFKPAALMLGYPVLKEDVSLGCLKNTIAPIDYVGYDTPPCFLFGSRDDDLVDVRNIIEFEAKLCDYGISFSSHIYPSGGHGFATGDEWITQNGNTPSNLTSWLDESFLWLEGLFGKMGRDGFENPKLSPKWNEDNGPYYSIDCSLGYLLNSNNKEVLEIIKPLSDKYEGLHNNKKISDLDYYAFKLRKLSFFIKWLNFDNEINIYQEKLTKIRK